MSGFATCHAFQTAISETFFPALVMEAAAFHRPHHVTFIADVKDFAVIYVTCFTLSMKNSSHMVPSWQNRASWTCYMHVQTWQRAFNSVMFDKDHLAHCNMRITCGSKVMLFDLFGFFVRVRNMKTYNKNRKLCR